VYKGICYSDAAELEPVKIRPEIKKGEKT